ncbi:histocompatibility antigen 60b-like [Rattus norvegicus]|uniref:histocompatibility antigen 60b-like n=1 Tax=Rattus norvegicus TaxID=10116 RepID=UPI001917176E|nr:histocompatibility antigen 60b-like [Rattus norvegicus]
MAKGATSKCNHSLTLSLLVLLNSLGTMQVDGNHTLRVTVQSQYNQGEFMDGCWAFMIDRQYPFYFYPKNMTWRENQPNAIKTMSQWENNRELFQSLKFLSTGDFSLCLKKLLTDSRELTRSTIKAPDTTQPTSTTQSPSTGNSTPAMSSNQSSSTGNSTQPTSTTDYLIIFEFTAIFLALIVVSMEKKRCFLLLPFLFSMNFSPHHQLYGMNLEHISVASPAKEHISHDISENLAADFEPDCHSVI